MRGIALRVAVTILLASAVTLQAVPAQAAPAAPAAPAPASGLPWSSGVFTDHSASSAQGFATWRGRAIDNIAVYPSRESWAAMNNTWYLSSRTIPARFTGDIIAGVPLWPMNSSVTADASSQWRTFAAQLARKDPDAYVRLGYEMNIAQFWGITPANQAQWITAFNRAVAAMKSVAPRLRIVWNPNWGPDQTGVDSRSVFQAIKNSVSVYAIDMYDAYPADTSDAAADFRLNGAGGLADSMSYAVQNGKKFALAEWGLGCTTDGCQWQGHAGGDNPRYINDTLDFLGAHAADVAFESYLNEPASYVRSALYPAAVNPNAGAAYVAKLASLAAARAGPISRPKPITR